MKSWVAAAAALALGCAAPVRESKPVVEFPTPAALAAIEARPAAPPKLEAAAPPTEGWTIDVEREPPTAADEWTPTTAWDRGFAAAVKQTGRPVRLSQALACTAREIGRYYVRHGVLPPDGLRVFMTGACGGSAAEVGAWMVPAQVPDNVPAAALDAARPKITAEVLRGLPAQATHGGFDFQRGHGRAVATLTFARMAAEVQPFSVVADASGEIKIDGELHDQAEYIAGYINQGRHGFLSCYVDPSVARPRFHVSCPLAAEDTSAWIQIVYAPPRRVLARPFLQVLARRTGAGPLTYTEVSLPEGAPAATAEDFAGRLVTTLNQIRGESGMPAVRLNSAQSGTATGLAGHYFAAALAEGGGQEEAETIALGMLAGWQVGGMIRDGSFYSRLVAHSRDPGRWLSSTLTMPTGRCALLDPSIEEIALGPVLLSAPEGIGALVTGYRFHHGDQHASDVKRLLMRTAWARRRLSLSPPGRLAGMDAVMRAELGKVNAGTANPLDALQAVLEWGVAHFGAGFRGYVVEASSLEALQIPPEVLSQPTLHLDIGVTHHKPPGAAWAQLVILVAFVDYGDRTS
jgi:hypothetical protein